MFKQIIYFQSCKTFSQQIGKICRNCGIASHVNYDSTINRLYARNDVNCSEIEIQIN